MIIELDSPFASDGAVDELDVRRMKKALNRLGYYQPYDKTGITGIPDAGVFAALRAFQKDHGLRPTGTARPGDATTRALNEATRKAPKGRYIWRTVGDDRVRTSHAAFNRTVRSWKDDPDPGEEINCRCWAQPIAQAEGLSQKVISPINDIWWKWQRMDFLGHFYLGRGAPKTLPNIGYLGDVIKKAREIMFHRLEDQIAEKMRIIKEGVFTYDTRKSYDFEDVKYEFGSGIIITHTIGFVTRDGNILHLRAIVNYAYDDEFTDLVSIREKAIYGTSSPEGISYWPVKLTDLLGTRYKITGKWTTEMKGSILLNEE